jgi:hypothetical protein
MSTHKERKITVHRARSAQNEPGVLIPLDATIISADLDSLAEHGSVVYYTAEEVEVEDEADAAQEA